MDTKESAAVQTIFKVKMGGDKNTDQIMAALGFPFDEQINQKNFPLVLGKTSWEDEIEIIDPGKNFREDEGLQILKNKGLEPPTYEKFHGTQIAGKKKAGGREREEGNDKGFFR
jgi:hypothetical protein